MKNKIIIFWVIISLFSCTKLEDKLYDNLPPDHYPENDLQASLLELEAYAAFSNFLDWGGWYFAQEVTTDEVTVPTRLTDWDDGGKWRELHQHTWTNRTEAVSAMWGTFYWGVGVCNKIIDDMSQNAEEPAVKARIMKLKTLRSYYYYLLIDNYGDVPYVTSYYTAEQNPHKEARASVFQKIVNEIQAALPYLKDNTSKTQINKSFAYATLAKLYLNAEVYAGVSRWDSAEMYCDSIIESGHFALESDPLQPFVTENENSPENIFVIPNDEDNYKGFNLHMRTLHYDSKKTFDMTVQPWNGFCAIEDFYNLYADNDLRKNYFLVGQQYDSGGEPINDATTETPLIFSPHIPALFMDGTYTPEEIRMSGARVVKFEVKLGAKADLSNDFPIYRYADILLMKAEAMIRQGKNGDDYVNMIRNRAGLEDWNNVDLDMLLEERGRELFWEAHRRQDLIRFGRFNDAWWEKEVSSPDRNTFPIPQWVLDSNPDIDG